MQDNDCLTFSYFQSPSPTLPRAQLYPIDIPSSSTSARGFEICFPIFPFDCLVSKPFLCSKPQHPRVWLAEHQAKESGSVTAFALFGCSESSSQPGTQALGKCSSGQVVRMDAGSSGTGRPVALPWRSLGDKERWEG